MRMRPQSRGITAPSVEEVMRKLSSRWPSTRWVGASEETIQLSTTAPTVEPIMPPMVAAQTPRIAPPMQPPMAAPAAPRTRVAIGGAPGERVLRCGRRAGAGGRTSTQHVRPGWRGPCSRWKNSRQAVLLGGKQPYGAAALRSQRSWKTGNWC